MPLRQPVGNTLPMDQFLAAQSLNFSPSLGETASEVIPEGLKSTIGGGTAYKDIVTPDLAITREPSGPGGARAPAKVSYDTAPEVAARGDILYETPEQYKKGPYYDPDVPWVKGMTESNAKAKFDLITQTKAREVYKKARPYSSMLFMLGSQFGDPLNYVPVLGPMIKGGTAARLAFVAAENVANIGLAEMATANTRYQFNKNDVAPEQMAQDIGMAMLVGPLVHSVARVIGYGLSRYREIPTPKGPPKLEDYLPPEPPKGPNITSEQGVTATYKQGWNVNAETEKNVMASRMILNDGIYSLLNDDQIKLSEGSKGIFNQLGPEIVHAVEADKYQYTKSPETRARETELTAQIAEHQTKLDEMNARNQTDPAMAANPDEQYKRLTEYYKTKADLTNAYVDLAKLRAQHYGYRTDPPKILEGVNYDLMVNHQQLPEEVQNLMSQTQKNRVDELSSQLQYYHDESMRIKIEEEVAKAVGPLYAGVYGRLYHGTQYVFDQFDPKHFGKNTNASDARSAVFLSGHPDTANNYSDLDIEGPYNTKGKAPNTQLLNVDLRNPYVMDMHGGGYVEEVFNHHVESAKKNGNDGVIFTNVHDSGPKDTVYAVFDPNKITNATNTPREISWAEPNMEFGEPTMQIDEVQKLAKEFTDLSSADSKLVEQAKLEGFNLDAANPIIDTEADRMDIEIAKVGMTPEESRAFDEELGLYDAAIKDTQRQTDATNAAATCRSGK